MMITISEQVLNDKKIPPSAKLLLGYVQMKKGKSVKLNLFNPIKSVYGTVDSKNLKSVYINIQSWVTPKDDYDNWNRVVSNLGREIKHSVFESINQQYPSIQQILELIKYLP